MSRPRLNKLPRYLEFNSRTRSYYYRHPGMEKKAPLGKDATTAIELARVLNSKYRIQLEQESARVEAALDFGSPRLGVALAAFVEKYIVDYRIKPSTAALLRQRRDRLARCLGDMQVAVLDTQMLREAIACSSQFEQAKMKTLLMRFFRYAKSTGIYPCHLTNPVNDLLVDPVPMKIRRRMRFTQFQAIYRAAPPWMQWLMTLAFHLALRRVDLVNLRFEDVREGRIVSPIRKTDTEARELESTSVDFPIHPDVQRAIVAARKSSLRAGRCPFIIHREPERRTKRACDALDGGRMEHPAQVLPDYATKAFNKVRRMACKSTTAFEGLTGRQLPTLHEIRALSSHLYALSGHEVAAVQDLMAHTDPDMTRAYQRGHARKILRVNMMLPFSVEDDERTVREEPAKYEHAMATRRQEIFPEDFLTQIPLVA